MTFKYIGKGSFTTALLNCSNSKVYLKSIDNTKECRAHGWFPDHKLFNKIEFCDFHEEETIKKFIPVHKDTEFNFYKTDYLEKVRAPKKQLNEEAYNLYFFLRTCNAESGYTFLQSIDRGIDDGSIKEDEGEAIQEAFQALRNYSEIEDIFFEISPRNIATNENGDLILLDTFFFRSQLHRVRTENVY